MAQTIVILFESFSEYFEHLRPVLKQIAGYAFHDLLLQLAKLRSPLILALTLLVKTTIGATLHTFIERILLLVMIMTLLALVEQIACLLKLL